MECNGDKKLKLCMNNLVANDNFSSVVVSIDDDEQLVLQ